jgi:hypothetical protein
MKLTDTVNSGSVAPTSDANTYSIAATGKAFRVLSDGLYSRKIAAVIRELSCNAMDSHVAAGKPDVPFEVHLPTYAEQYFSVTDFGTGIKDSDIYSIYTRYFASTKTDSNDYTGQLGLGSKSPFSIVNEFTVESTVDGVYNKYKMVFNENDKPRVESLATGVANKSGVTVSMKVDSKDFERFKNDAQEILCWFAVTPIITGNVVTIENNVAAMPDDGFMLRNDVDIYSNAKPIALMGNVAYPIHSDSFDNLTSDELVITTLPVIIKFDIGDLEVSASRESLGYDARTMKNIKAKLSVGVKKIVDDHLAQMASKQTEWAACNTYAIWFDSSNIARRILPLFHSKPLKWNGKKIASKFITNDLSTVYSSTSGKVRRGESMRNYLENVSAGSYKSFMQNCADQNIAVINDVDRNGLGRVRHWLSNERRTVSATVYEKPELITVNELIEKLGNPPTLVLASSLPIPPKNAAAPKQKVLMKVFDSIYWSKSQNKIAWRNDDVDVEAGGFWIESDKRDVFDAAGNMIQPGTINAILYLAKKVGLITNDIAVCSPGNAMMLRKIKADRKWINVHTYISKKLAKLFDLVNMDIMATADEWDRLTNGTNKQILSYVEHDYNLRDENSYMIEMKKLKDEMTSINQNSFVKAMLSAKTLGAHLNVKCPDGVVDGRLAKMVSEFARRYPMLRHLAYSEYRDQDVATIEVVNHYIDLCDQNELYFTLAYPDELVAE